MARKSTTRSRLAMALPRTTKNANGNNVVAAKQYTASIHFAHTEPGRTKEGVPPDFVRLIELLEAQIKMPVWLLVQNGTTRYSQIDHATFKGFQKAKSEIEEGKPAALLVESPGGIPGKAYYIARYFQRRVSRFVTIVPQFAKSAATLVALGGSEILMARDAELGPLDVQIFDSTRERYGSALNTLQSLERLHADAMTIVDEMMQLLVLRTGKKVDALLSTVLHHGTEFVRPLVDKIDTVDYTEKSRALKMAEEYAVRLMVGAGYDAEDAEMIARQLVTQYPDHGFIIDADEAKRLVTIPNKEPKGLAVLECSNETEEIFEQLLPFLDSLTVIGRLREV